MVAGYVRGQSDLHALSLLEELKKMTQTVWKIQIFIVEKTQQILQFDFFNQLFVIKTNIFFSLRSYFSRETFLILQYTE